MVDPNALPRVLFVDDQLRLLEGLERQVRGVVQTQLLTSPVEAAELLERTAATDEAFAAIVSDMRMPEMDGAALLKHAKAVSPDTTRLLLTGYSDINHAMAAVNEGSIFRFLMKPCSTPILRAAIDDAIEQHTLIRDRRELLEQTLRGAIEALVEALTMVHPAAFARASRLRGLARETALRLKLPDPWQIEVAAQLGEIGIITLPPEALDALVRGTSPNPAITRMLRDLPDVADDVLRRIPRLDGVRAIVRAQQPVDQPDLSALERADDASRLLQAIREYDALISRGQSPYNAIEAMRSRGLYSPAALEALRDVASTQDSVEVKEVDIAALRPGLVLAADLRSRKGGMLLVKDGHVLTEQLLTRIRNFERLGGLESRPLIYVDRR